MVLPPIVQGGMGIAVSGWQLAAAVSREGQMGVVSGTGLSITVAQRLQRGDPGGHLREAFAAFPSQQLADRVYKRWYVAEGANTPRSLAGATMPSWPMRPELLELTVIAVFAEVYLARHHGGPGPIGVNLLTKVEIMTLPSLYGAMLAGVDAVFMGAGIPRTIPGVLDAFARGTQANLALSVAGSDAEPMHLDPASLLGSPAPELRRPLFFPIIASDVLASIMLRKSNGPIDGFVIEGHSAGGHNAPPRRRHTNIASGETVWQEHDLPSLQAFRKLGLPFYLAGGQDTAASLSGAREAGATGIQIGTAFAFCEESGLRADLKAAALQAAAHGELQVKSDSLASPTGFPFKVVQLAGTLSDDVVYAERQRNCDIGHLRSAYRKADGGVGWRCPAEREAAYVSKGGAPDDLACRRCLCAGLMAAAGYGDADAPAILTAGDTLQTLSRMLKPGHDTYSAHDVINLVCGTAVEEPAAISPATFAVNNKPQHAT